MSYPMMVVSMNHATVEAIDDERGAQIKKFGCQDHDDGRWVLILGEEFGEVCQASLEGLPVREELIHLVAVAVAWYEAINRR